MKKGKPMFYVLAVCLVFFIGSTIPSWAEYPDRPVKILVGFKAGGSVDTMAW